jgi:hypothetical protein
MAVKRYRSHTDRTRRRAAFAFIPIGAVMLSLIVWGAVHSRGFPVWALIAAIVPLAFVGAGVYFLTHVFAAVDVDLEQRRYWLIRGNKPAGGGSLDELGPLRVTREERVMRSSRADEMDRRHTQYCIKPAGYGFLELDAYGSPGAARRKLEDLAREWTLPCRSLDGPVRAPEHLDAPLHVRLEKDAEARVAAPLRPEWRIRIEPIFRGHRIASYHRSYQPLASTAVLAAIVAFGAFQMWDASLLDSLRGMPADPLGRVFLGIGAVMAASLLWKLAGGVRDTFYPGAIEVSDRGVAYRGSRMKFDRIEEITAGTGIEIVGDRRVLAIPASFCPPQAVKPIAHELQRLILEAAPRAGI